MKNKIKNIYFVGIGGSGMSGIAEVMHNLKFNVQGSDLGKSEAITHLKKIGIKIFSNHLEENIKNIDVLVISAAISGHSIRLISRRFIFSWKPDKNHSLGSVNL